MPGVPGVGRTMIRKYMLPLALTLAIMLLLAVVPARADSLTPTNEWVNFYGLNTLLDGQPVPVGAVITAYNPRGVLCGRFVVHTAGQYGVLPVYRDDASTDNDEGARPGETVSFRINGQPATVLGPGAPVWTANGDVVELNLSASSGAPAPTATPTSTTAPPTDTPAPTPTTAPPTTPVATPEGTLPAPQWVNFYGTNSTMDGAPIPVGALVEAYAPDGTKCGQFSVTVAGQYGVLACLGAPSGQPGAKPGNTIYFTINGRAALTVGPGNPIWTANGDLHHVELQIPPGPHTPTPTPTRTVTVPAPTPTWTPRPPDHCVGITYTVRWGDWLYKIARQFGVTVNDILRCNHIPNPNYIRPGQQLLIPTGVPPTPTTPVPTTPTPPPPGTVYIVRPGDTLTAIAGRFGTTIQAIMAANNLTNPNYIWVGQRLIIPGIVAPPTPPPSKTYVVRAGDSLWSISLRYGINWRSIAIANNLYYPYIIYPGQVLVIP